MRSPQFKIQQKSFWGIVTALVLSMFVCYSHIFEFTENVLIVAKPCLLIVAILAQSAAIGFMHRWGVGIVLDEYFNPTGEVEFDLGNRKEGERLIKIGLLGVTFLLLTMPICGSILYLFFQS